MEGLARDEVDLVEEDWKEMLDNLDNLRINGLWNDFVENAVTARTVYDKFEDYEIRDEDWKGMFDFIDIARDNNDYTFLEYLVQLKMLLAEKVVIKEDKFEVVMPKRKEEFKAEKKPRPERKTF